MTQVKQAMAANGRVHRVCRTRGVPRVSRDARPAPHTLRHPAGRMLLTGGAPRVSRDARPAAHAPGSPRAPPVLERPPAAPPARREGSAGSARTAGPAPCPCRRWVNGTKTGSVPGLPYLALWSRVWKHLTGIDAKTSLLGKSHRFCRLRMELPRQFA